MAGAILEILEYPELAKMLGMNAYQRGHKRNDIVSICENLLKIYQKVLSIEANQSKENKGRNEVDQIEKSVVNHKDR